MGKKTKIFLIVLLVISLLLYLFANNDDDLDPKAAKWTKALNSRENTPSNGHLFALGWHAPQNENPEELGRRIQENYLDHLKNKPVKPTDGPDVIQIDNQLQKPERKNTCNVSIKECVNYFLAKDTAFIKSHLKKHETSYERYNQYLSFDSHHYTSPPGLHSPIPYYQYQIQGNHLFLIKNILDIKNNKSEQVVNSVLSDLKKNRKILEQATTLIEKMIQAAIIKNNIEFLSLLAQHSHINNLQNIPLLTKEELSMYEPFRFEFVLTTSMFHELNSTNYLFSNKFRLPKFINKILVKKNRSINSSLKGYEFYFENDSAPAMEYMQKQKKYVNTNNKTQKYNYKNFAGQILVNIAKPEYSEYKYRLFDLNQKILLFNNYIAEQKYKINNWDKTLVTSIYDKTKHSEIENSQICLYSPLNNKKVSPCLDIIK